MMETSRGAAPCPVAHPPRILGADLSVGKQAATAFAEAEALGEQGLPLGDGGLARAKAPLPQLGLLCLAAHVGRAEDLLQAHVGEGGRRLWRRVMQAR